ncbi:MAG: uroporphyrinogen-III synthase [Pseudomonadota bacterium]
MGDNPGRPILLTRPRAQSERFAEQVLTRLPNAQIVVSPILTIVPCQTPIPLKGVGAVILSSENGARALAEESGISGLAAYCVGERTARVAASLGLEPHSADGDADSLVALIRKAAPSGHLLHVRGAESRGAIAERLGAAGLTVSEFVAYEQKPMPLNDAAKALLAAPKPVITPLFSPRSSALLGAVWRDAAAPAWLACLSSAIREAWSGPTPDRVRVAKAPRASDLLVELVALYRESLP